MGSMHTARLLTSPYRYVDHDQWPAQRDVVYDSSLDAFPSSRGFVSMLVAYRPSGGTLSSQELAQLLADSQPSESISLTRLIAERRIFGFTWRSTFWVPMFQFELRSLTIRPESHLVLIELAKSFDEWSIATWFTCHNTWLDNNKPIELLDSDFLAVLDAARTDRFVAALVADRYI